LFREQQQQQPETTASSVGGDSGEILCFAALLLAFRELLCSHRELNDER